MIQGIIFPATADVVVLSPLIRDNIAFNQGPDFMGTVAGPKSVAGPIIQVSD
jgi:hypothetical protein